MRSLTVPDRAILQPIFQLREARADRSTSFEKPPPLFRDLPSFEYSRSDAFGLYLFRLNVPPTFDVEVAGPNRRSGAPSSEMASFRLKRAVRISACTLRSL